MIGVVALVLFCLLLLLRVPVSVSMLMASLIALLAVGRIPLLVLPQMIGHGLGKFELLAVPFFILAAEIMNAGGLTFRIFRFAKALVGWMPGGLAQVNVVASVVFAGLSGTAMADAAGLGRIEIKAMRDADYDAGFACAVTLASCIVGPLVPPSVVMIIYAITAEVSVGAMLLAGVGPGLMLAGLLMGFVYVAAKTGMYHCPIVPASGRDEVIRFLVEGAPALVAPILIVAGIVGGIFTATEAGVAACIYSLAVSLTVYRELTWRRFAQVLVRATLSSAMIMFLIGCASVLAWIVTRERVAAEAAAWIARFSTERWSQLLVINVFLLMVGCLIEGLPALLIMIPVMLPVALQIGVDPVHFGVILVFNILVGIITPPMGVGLFVVASYTGVPFERITRACIPFFIPLLLALMVITFVPELSLWLPRVLLG
jgi:tripartite ATP-independent transporter DctM subunit